ncbi:GAF domain-containing protein [Cesiribacter andamanensis]|uniref:Putative periplasmic ligand-binding sensor domain protein n=1 Tax=Cesiribacter andamanensis AMV16 TaxID=1279009 RepID=M7MW78_9BACT|nr:GAF domain-containing protein [Cesiribacter andamanensis]EMR00693.1 putative periplasmic ligand-binding sensor domain protein [Cesiribacter andamanensis AMV16]
MINNLLTLGVREHYPEYLQHKIRISNILWIVMLFFAGGYSLIIGLKIPALSFIPIVGTSSMVGALLLNFLGFHVLYRLLLTAGPLFSVYCYHLGVVPANGTALPSSIALILAFSILPFILFDVREKGALGFSIFVGYLALISFRWTNSWIEIPDINEAAIRSGLYQEFSITASFIVLCSTVYSLTYFAFNAERTRNRLLEEGEQKTRQLQAREAELQEHLHKLELSRKEEQQRNWAAQGFTHFAGLLRKNDNQQQLADELLRELTRYIDANQGALYLVEGVGEELHLQLKACYAYSRKKYREQRLQPGEGLIGQCYLERESVYITDVPQGYTHITSGLGDATPSAILIVPLIANEKVEGILEFASFSPFAPHIRQFVEKLGVDIAATLGISRINTLTRQLLDDARQQAEQMRAQEEEMRQNLEELAATQEEMQRKEKEYMRQIAELQAALQLQES